MEPGDEFGPTDSLIVDQARIDAFAAVTEDHQWIHVDPRRAKSGPFGGTIAHGYLTLSLVAPAFFQLLPLDGGMIVNYGLDRVRFPVPVPCGAAIRVRLAVEAVSELDGGHEVVVAATVELQGADKPCCVATVRLRPYV